MRKYILKSINILTGFILLSCLHCTFTAVITGNDEQVFYHSLIYLPMVILLSVSSKKCRKAWQYLIFAGLAVGIAYYAGAAGVEKMLSIILAIAAGLSYFAARSKNKNCWLDEPGYPFLGIFLGMYLLEMRFESELVETYAVIGVGVYYLLCTYQTNLSRVEHLITTDSKLERFPLKRLVQSNYLMLGIQTILVTIGMCIAPFAGIDGLIYKAAEILRRIIAWLLSGLESEEATEVVQEAAEQADFGLVQAGETSSFLEFLLKLWEVLSWIIVIVITGYAIYRILKFLYQLYLDFDMRSAENGDQIEQIYKVGSSKEKKIRVREKKENLFWDRSPGAKIRKTYKKRVLAELKEAPGASMTPEEIESGISMEKEEKKIFHEYYEKARYAKEECTKEEMMRYKF